MAAFTTRFRSWESRHKPWSCRRRWPPGTSPTEFGRQVQQEALRRGLARAQVVYLVMDGAVWLWDLAEDRFKDTLKTLDFHHAREHLRYRQMEKAEAPLGSGAVESLGKQLQRRLRRCRQYWARPAVTHRLRLCIMPITPIVRSFGADIYQQLWDARASASPFISRLPRSEVRG